jgi:hypothetical protein
MDFFCVVRTFFGAGVCVCETRGDRHTCRLRAPRAIVLLLLTWMLLPPHCASP